MRRPIAGTRREAAVVALLASHGLVGCGIEDRLLEPQQPGLITQGTIAAGGPPAAQALYVGAIGALKSWTGGGGSINSQNLWMYADLMTDVWKTSDTFSQRIDMDRRVVATLDAEVTGAYATVQQSRGFVRDALDAAQAYLPNEPGKQAEMYFALAYAEIGMSEVFCNGVPFGESVKGDVRYSVPLTNAQGFQRAVAHLDSAIALAAGTDTLSVRVRNAALVAKGRALVNLGRFAEAATTVAAVPTAYQFTLTFSQPTQPNTIWTTNATASSARYVVGDSVTLANGVEVRIRNAIPFASARDPRVPVTGSYRDASRIGFDGTTPWVGQLIWTAPESPIVLASGIDADLIEAEARLQSNDIPRMMSFLDALRASPRTLGTFTVPALPALATPASRAAAVDLLFREKAFWQFGRGMRLGDLRRLIRQYGRIEDETFPAGGFHKTPFTFGTDVNLPVPDAERTNPNFKGCLDRKA